MSVGCRYFLFKKRVGVWSHPQHRTGVYTHRMSHPLPTYTDPTRILDQRVKLAFAPCCRTSAHRCYYSLVTGQADRADAPLICQTPWLWLPCAPRYIVRQGARTYFFHLAFWNVADSPEQQTWLKLLRVLQTTFHGWVQRKHTGHGGAPVQWVPCIDTPLAPTYAFHDQVGAGAAALRGGVSPGAGPVHWKFHTRLPPSVGCYDAAGMAMDVSDVMTKGQATYVRLIVHLANVWVNEDTGTAGLGVHVLQFQQSGVAPPRTYAFRDASVTQRTCGCQTESTGAVVNAREAATRHPTAAATDPPAPPARPPNFFLSLGFDPFHICYLSRRCSVILWVSNIEPEIFLPTAWHSKSSLFLWKSSVLCIKTPIFVTKT